jgi:diaminohydroxyphosphoribosylaminopyrimidine deaminase / 5-amino-6-(5-phosphoribosylamino)uracil reductase
VKSGTVFADTHYMALALALAERGRGRTSPNPMVGAILVDREGVVVGRGTHEFAGGPHAEIQALRDAGERARGATLFCSLEPCCHTGRTGPCAPRVAEAGIRRAVIAVEDPNPMVSGGGISYLRAHEIDVTVGVMRKAAQRLNRPFFALMRLRRPFVTVKAALSLDGCSAARPGARTPMTSADADRLIHRERAEIDAIAVGSGTILADDPQLTARGAYRGRPLTRVVFDTRLRTPPSAKLFSTLTAGPVIIMTTPSATAAARERVRALVEAGARVEPVAAAPRLSAGLASLASMGVSSLLVEGGATLHQAFWDAGLVDRVELYVTPRSMGPSGLEWLPAPVISSGTMEEVTTRTVGVDVLIDAYVYRPD